MPVITGYGKLVLAEFDLQSQTRWNISVWSVKTKEEHVPAKEKGFAVTALEQNSARKSINKIDHYKKKETLSFLIVGERNAVDSNWVVAFSFIIKTRL